MVTRRHRLSACCSVGKTLDSLNLEADSTGQRQENGISIKLGTTIITFLMVFLIQNTQNRDTAAIQIKLDELIRVTKGAHNALLDLEELEEEALDIFRQKYQALAAAARKELDIGALDTGTPEAEQ